MPAGHAAAQEAAPAGLKVVLGQGAHKPAPKEEENVPAEQGVHAVTPAAELYVPAVHAMQAALDEAPMVADHVPAGQGTGAEFMGQKEPAGHSTGVPVTQLYDAGQGTQERRRMRLLSDTMMLPLRSRATPEG